MKHIQLLIVVFALVSGNITVAQSVVSKTKPAGLVRDMQTSSLII
jgi:hypothetical protein